MDLKTTLKKAEGEAKHSHTTSEHCNAALAAMHRMKKDLQMTDVVLKVDNGCIQAHRLVLASTSGYFFSMFNDDMLEKQLSEIVLRDINIETLKLLVDYLYTGDIQITEDNVESLLSASSLLQIWPVREGCSEFLEQHLHPLNCFGIWRFADTHGLSDLKDKSLKFVRRNFQKAVNSEEFLLLSSSELEEVISSNQLNVDSEEKVFLAVLNWVKHCESDRIQFVKKMLSYVRLQLIPHDFLMKTVASEVLVRDSVEYKELLFEIMKSILLSEKRTSSNNKETSPRTVKELEQYIFAIGGSSIGPSRESEAYSVQRYRWLNIAPMTYSRFGCGVTNVGRKLYAIGGCTNGSSCESYDPETNTWSIVTPMNEPRTYLGVSSLHEIVYACGGKRGYYNNILPSVDKYDPLSGVWSRCRPMSTAKYGFGMAVIDNCIYVLGGNSGHYNLQIVERLDPREGNWYRVRDMKSARGFCSATSVKSVLYCIGGTTTLGSSASGERFDVRNNKWEDIKPMHSARSHHQIVNCGDGLIALGGSGTSRDVSNSVELYDIKLNQWTPLAPMFVGRADFGASAMDCLNFNLP